MLLTLFPSIFVNLLIFVKLIFFFIEIDLIVIALTFFIKAIFMKCSFLIDLPIFYLTIHLRLFFLFNSKFFHEFSDIGLNFNSHGDDWVVLNVWYLKLLDWNDHSEVRFQELLVNCEKVIFFIKLQIFEQLQYPFELLSHILFW